MNNLSDCVNAYEVIIHQIPGFVAVHDLDYKIALANVNTIKAMGFKTLSDAIGKRYADMKCKAAEEARCFEAQDSFVFKNTKKLRFLSYFQYADNWKLTLGEKSPLINSNGKLIGLTSHMIDITKSSLVDISRFTSSLSKKFTYVIEDETSNHYQLSKRQIECLFYDKFFRSIYS